MKTLKEIKLHPWVNVVQEGLDGGAYVIKTPFGKLTVIASFGGGWDHVSVSKATRCPTWEEMCYVKDIFFNDDEVVIQYHPAKENYINNHPFCLHLWRPQNISLATPPMWMVGIKEA